MAACGYTPAEIDELTLNDVQNLFAYWHESPPVHEILKCVYRIEPKPAKPVMNITDDPSGLADLIAHFPHGCVRPNEPR